MPLPRGSNGPTGPYTTSEAAKRVGLTPGNLNYLARKSVVRPSGRLSRRQGSPRLWTNADLGALARVVQAKQSWAILHGTGKRAMWSQTVDAALRCVAFARDRDIIVSGPKGTAILGPGTSLTDAIRRVGNPTVVLASSAR